jgi:hypothetical protein
MDAKLARVRAQLEAATLSRAEAKAVAEQRARDVTPAPPDVTPAPPAATPAPRPPPDAAVAHSPPVHHRRGGSTAPHDLSPHAPSPHASSPLPTTTWAPPSPTTLNIHGPPSLPPMPPQFEPHVNHPTPHGSSVEAPPRPPTSGSATHSHHAPGSPAYRAAHRELDRVRGGAAGGDARRTALWVALCGVAVAIGVLLPWRTTEAEAYAPGSLPSEWPPTRSVNGTDGDSLGVAILVLGLLGGASAAAIGFGIDRFLPLKGRLLVPAVVAEFGVAAILTLADLARGAPERADAVSAPAIGIYLTLFAAAAGASIAVRLLRLLPGNGRHASPHLRHPP